jgi:hypothetical protein
MMPSSVGNPAGGHKERVITNRRLTLLAARTEPHWLSVLGAAGDRQALTAQELAHDDICVDFGVIHGTDHGDVLHEGRGPASAASDLRARVRMSRVSTVRQ